LSDFRAKEDEDGDHTKYIIVQKDGYLTPNPIGERAEKPMKKLIELSDAAVFRIRPADDKAARDLQPRLIRRRHSAVKS
jgi:hypothetical protein